MRNQIIAMMLAIAGWNTTASRVVFAAELDPGKKLHEAYCIACHNAKIYTRENRLIQSLGDLQQQIGACGHSTSKELSTSEIEDIVKYLNDRYYKFP